LLARVGLIHTASSKYHCCCVSMRMSGPAPPFPFPKRSLGPLPLPVSGAGPSQVLLASSNYIFNPFRVSQKTPSLRSFLTPPSVLASEPQLEHITGASNSSTINLQIDPSIPGVVSSTSPSVMTAELIDYEYSLEMNAVWVERLSNTMKRIKKKKKKRSVY
jgi:hypothetical protein